MARRAVGLIGPGLGPMVHVGGDASVEVCGADEGHLVGAKAYSRDGTHQALVFHNGRHAPVECHMIQFAYDGPSTTLVCTVHMES